MANTIGSSILSGAGNIAKGFGKAVVNDVLSRGGSLGSAVSKSIFSKSTSTAKLSQQGQIQSKAITGDDFIKAIDSLNRQQLSALNTVNQSIGAAALVNTQMQTSMLQQLGVISSQLSMLNQKSASQKSGGGLFDALAGNADKILEGGAAALAIKQLLPKVIPFALPLIFSGLAAYGISKIKDPVEEGKNWYDKLTPEQKRKIPTLEEYQAGKRSTLTNEEIKRNNIVKDPITSQNSSSGLQNVDVKLNDLSYQAKIIKFEADEITFDKKMGIGGSLGTSGGTSGGGFNDNAGQGGSSGSGRGNGSGGSSSEGPAGSQGSGSRSGQRGFGGSSGSGGDQNGRQGGQGFGSSGQGGYSVTGSPSNLGTGTGSALSGSGGISASGGKAFDPGKSSGFYKDNKENQPSIGSNPIKDGAVPYNAFNQHGPVDIGGTTSLSRDRTPGDFGTNRFGRIGGSTGPQFRSGQTPPWEGSRQGTGPGTSQTTPTGGGTGVSSGTAPAFWEQGGRLPFVTGSGRGQGIGSSGPGTNGELRGNFNSQAPEVMSRLMRDFDLTKEQAAGILGNLGHESSGLQAGIQEGGKKYGAGGLGWAQWTGSRRRSFERFARENNMSVNDPETNYRYLKAELSGEIPGFDYSRSIRELKNINNVRDATLAFEESYEGAGVKLYNSRINYANRALSSYNNFQSGSSSAIAPGSRSGDMDHIKGLQPEVYNRLSALASAYKEKTGRALPINSANRSFEEQSQLYANRGSNPNPVARPGHSRHEGGKAFDIPAGVADYLDNSGMLSKFGLHRPVAGDPVHIEVDPKAAPLDSNTMGKIQSPQSTSSDSFNNYKPDPGFPTNAFTPDQKGKPSIGDKPSEPKAPLEPSIKEMSPEMEQQLLRGQENQTENTDQLIDQSKAKEDAKEDSGKNITINNNDNSSKSSGSSGGDKQSKADMDLPDDSQYAKYFADSSNDTA